MDDMSMMTNHVMLFCPAGVDGRAHFYHNTQTFEISVSMKNKHVANSWSYITINLSLDLMADFSHVDEWLPASIIRVQEMANRVPDMPTT
jgi:hypothetical protein